MADVDKLILLRTIIESEWWDLKGVITPNRPNLLLDLIFSIHRGRIFLTAQAHCVSDDNEAFSLDIGVYPEEGRWKGGAGPDFLITKELITGSMSQLLTPPRVVRFFTDPRLTERTYPKEVVPFDNCSAIEFLKNVAGTDSRLVIAASRGSPCEIEIGTSNANCDSLLFGLDRFELL